MDRYKLSLWSAITEIFNTFETYNRRIKLAGKNFRVFWSDKSWKTWFASVFFSHKVIEILVTDNQGPVRVTRLSKLPWWGNLSYISLQNTEKTVKNKKHPTNHSSNKSCKTKIKCFPIFTYSKGLPFPSPLTVKQCPLTVPSKVSSVIISAFVITLCGIEKEYMRYWPSVRSRWLDIG